MYRTLFQKAHKFLINIWSTVVFNPLTLTTGSVFSISVIVVDCAQTEYFSTFHSLSVRPCVTYMTSLISHLSFLTFVSFLTYINVMLIIRGPIRPQSESKSSWLFKNGKGTQVQIQKQFQRRRQRQRRQENNWNINSVLYFQNPDGSPSTTQNCPVLSSTAQYSLVHPGTF